MFTPPQRPRGGIVEWVIGFIFLGIIVEVAIGFIVKLLPYCLIGLLVVGAAGVISRRYRRW